MTYGTINADVIGTSVANTSLGAGNASTLKNRIINGAMVINQRAFNGTAVGGTYTLDRWSTNSSQTSKFSISQSSTAPAGFANSLLATSLSAYSVGASDYFNIYQPIEGYNFADLGWGTANAKTVTLSFWVQSSLTGTFGGSFCNASVNRSYPFTYSIPVANTWTQVNVTVAGDTTGTWTGATNGVGVYVIFGLGSGSATSGTANTWASAYYTAPTGATSVVGTNGATFYITGVQLEVGSSATGFEYRQYQQELALCQRYYETTATNGVIGINETSVQVVWNTAYCTAPQFKVTKRAAPTVTIYSRGGTAGQVSSTASGVNVSTATASNISSSGIWSIFLTTSQTAYSAGMEAGFTASAEL
jgi:hypothetical protein